MANRWDKPDIPHKGWRCVNIIDLRPDGEQINADEYKTCEMCDHYPIRFVHVMERDNHAGQLKVGSVCDVKMSSDYVNPKDHKTLLKKKVNLKRKWLFYKKWRTLKNGNSCLRKKDMTLTVIQNWNNSYRWKYRISYTGGTRPELSKDSYSSENAAKLALFERYWEKIIRQGIFVSEPTRPAFDHPCLDYELPDGGTIRELLKQQSTQRPHHFVPPPGNNGPEGVIIHKKRKSI